MAFDPNLPQTNSPLSSAEMRDQFAGLYQFTCEHLDGCALTPRNVVGLTLDISDPPTKAQVEAIRDKLNEMLTAMS